MFVRLLFGTAFFLAATVAHSFEFKAVNDHVVVYDAGSKQSSPQFILMRGTPVEVIVATDRWAKIRESGGGMGWIERSQLAEPKQVIVTGATAEVRQAADAAAPVVFVAAKDVLLEVADKPANGWLKVRHRDGQTGFVSIRTVWGL